jgi:hypothetical protein
MISCSESFIVSPAFERAQKYSIRAGEAAKTGEIDEMVVYG